MNEILHRRTRLQNPTLNRGCGGTCHIVLSHMPALVQDFFHQQSVPFRGVKDPYDLKVMFFLSCLVGVIREISGRHMISQTLFDELTRGLQAVLWSACANDQFCVELPIDECHARGVFTYILMSAVGTEGNVACCAGCVYRRQDPTMQ